MNPKPILACTISLVIMLACPQVSGAISPSSVDDFQSGTAEGWRHQNTNAHSPVNVADVGPTGPGDHSLQMSSSGTGTSGSRFLAFNSSANWTGDYLAAGVTALQAEFNNIGAIDARDLDMRLALNGPGGWFTTDIFAVNKGGGWQSPVAFPVTPAGLTYVGGLPSDLDATLSGVTEIQLFSAAMFPIMCASRPRGDRIQAIAYVDNITAIAPLPFLLGDMDNNGTTDFDDLNPMVLALTNPGLYFDTFGILPTQNGDIDGNGGVDFDDINPLVALLTGGGGDAATASVPEPSSLLLLSLGVFTMLTSRRRRAR